MATLLPEDVMEYRITRHAIEMALDSERGFAKTEEEAVERIRAALKAQASVYRSKIHPTQLKVHDTDGRMVVIVDPPNRIIPTVFVSGHLKDENGVEVKDKPKPRERIPKGAGYCRKNGRLQWN